MPERQPAPEETQRICASDLAFRIPVARGIALTIVATFDADSSRVWIDLVVTWRITVPWAIAGVRWRNTRFNR